jgi:uncharacterized protein
VHFVEIETVTLHTIDGVALTADIATGPSPTLAAVIAHPHPLYGGDRHNHVVNALWRGIAEPGGVALRFDFRGAGDSGGRHDSGRAERCDVLAALDELTQRHPDLKVWLVGYSFGALVVADIDHVQVAGWVLIAPPLTMGSGRASMAHCATDDRPTLVLVPQHDEFCPPAQVERLCEGWTSTDRQVVPSATHGLVAQGSWLNSRVTAFLAAPRQRPASPDQPR